ncbi:MAG: zinc-dependent alcohol dehydrogenase family protein [Henriciella sp.]
METTGLLYRHFGSPLETLEIFKSNRGELQSGQVEVGIDLAPINPSDLVAISGAYPTYTKLPKVAGYEAVGRITRVGKGTRFAIGERVIPIATSGTWQTHLMLDAGKAIKVPDFLNEDVAARAYINPLSAQLMLSLAGITGKSVILTAGGSNCARLMGQWALSAGAKNVFSITRSATHDLALLELGVVPLRPAEALEMSFAHSVCFDAVGGSFALELMKSLPSGSCFVSYGLLSGQPITIVPAGIDFRQFHLRNWIHTASAQEVQHKFDDLFDRLQSASLPGAAEYNWTEWPKALGHFWLRGRERKPVMRFSAARSIQEL